MAATSFVWEADAIQQAYTSALAEGRLLLQRCACGRCFLPAKVSCPGCLDARWTWQTAGGEGRLTSWVVYHVALHPAFRSRLPYNVALVELDEGVRMITNIVADHTLLCADARVRFVTTSEGAEPLARFELVR